MCNPNKDNRPIAPPTHHDFDLISFGSPQRVPCHLAVEGLIIEDLHDGNVLVDEAYEVQVIDPVLFLI